MKIAELAARDRDLPRPTTWAADKPDVLRFLTAGEPVLGATTRLPDELDPDHPRRVPMIYYTDGEWIWSGEDIYYAERHDLPVDPELIKHARARGFNVGQVSEDAIDEAIDLLEGGDEHDAE